MVLAFISGHLRAERKQANRMQGFWWRAFSKLVVELRDSSIVFDGGPGAVRETTHYIEPVEGRPADCIGFIFAPMSAGGCLWAWGYGTATTQATLIMISPRLTREDAMGVAAAHFQLTVSA